MTFTKTVIVLENVILKFSKVSIAFDEKKGIFDVTFCHVTNSSCHQIIKLHSKSYLGFTSNFVCLSTCKSRQFTVNLLKFYSNSRFLSIEVSSFTAKNQTLRLRSYQSI